MRWLAALSLSLILWPAPADEGTPAVRVGSKQFTESVILGELATQLLQHNGIEARHKGQLGGTRFLWQSLLTGEIDVYPEYTGTIAEEILGGALQGKKDLAAVRRALAEEGVLMSGPLGFDNGYALGMQLARARALSIQTISDLRGHPQLKLGFSNEFMDRADGWPGLQAHYRLPHQDVAGLDHDLAYRGLVSGSLDVTDLYTTDAELQSRQLRILEDDQGYFPDYRAVFLYRPDLVQRQPEALAALQRLEDAIPQESMIAMNARAEHDRIPETQVAADFLRETLGIAAKPKLDSAGAVLWRHTMEHLALVGVSLSAAVIVAIPLGILCARARRLAQITLGIAGIVQTIPALALLVFMIPVLGIGGLPAAVALFLYSLLPIVRNTYTGLQEVPRSLIESADALGLTPSARLRLVELPLATRTVLAGVKTAAVINVGTATLGALIGAGGYGQPILTGIRLNDTSLILQGAVPAAALALIIQAVFELAERWLVPKGLR
jgi:osmoprotectant transport system permease protein